MANLIWKYHRLLYNFINNPYWSLFYKILRIPERHLFGLLIISASLNMMEIINLDALVIIFVFVQLIMGSFFCSNMNGLTWRIAKLYIGHAMSIVISLGLCMTPFLLVIISIINARPEAIILGYSPGGINEMGLVTATLGIKPTFGITHHLFRLFIVVLIIGFAQKFIYPKLKTLI